MADRDQIISFCDELLDAGEFTDYGPNGLQVPGRHEVTRIATAVSAHRASIEAAIEAEADMLLCHHGLFWVFHPLGLTEAMAERLRLALGAELSVAGYHLPLDWHPSIGNNALLAEALGLELGEGEPQRLGEVKGRQIGVVARSAQPLSIAELCRRIEAELGREPLLQGDGPETVRTVGIISGSAAGEIHEAIELGLDAFITGEPAEHAMADAREGGIHFIAAGHYATETSGIRRLGRLIAEELAVEHVFCDFPNPV